MTSVSPPFYFVRDKSSSVAHHWDYERGRSDHALCGCPYMEPKWEGAERPRAVCRACQSRLLTYEARWWKAQAQKLRDELAYLTEQSEKRAAELQERIDNQRRALAQLNAKIERVTSDSGTVSRRRSEP